MNTLHDFLTSTDEFYLYLTFQFFMCLAAFATGWISAWIWLIKKANNDMTKEKTHDEDWSM